jgi:phage shock protein C
MSDHLYRSRDDRILLGVAGGLAHHFNLDPSLVRVAWVILLLPTAGFAIVLYIVMAFVVPEEPAGDTRWAAWGQASGASPWPDPAAAGPTTGPTSAFAASSGPADPSAAGATSTAASGPTGPTASSASGAPGGSSASATAGGPLGVRSGMFPSAASAPQASARTMRMDARDQRRQVRQERREWRREHRDGTAALLFGLILILVGGYFLVRAAVPSINVDQAWPILLVVIGLALLVGSVRRSGGPTT